MQKSLSENIKIIKDKFGSSDELIIKEIKVKNTDVAIVYLLGLNDTVMLSKFVVMPLVECDEEIKNLDYLSNNILTISETSIESDENKVVSQLLKGKGILFVDGFDNAVILAIDKFKERSIEEPPTSAVIKGPRAGFVESLKTNLAVLRKIIATPKLRTINSNIGVETQTAVTIAYIDGIADMDIVNKIQERLKEINIDGIIDSYYVASFLEEHKNSMFRQIGSYEKPDIVASKLLEGRIAIIVDGSPIVLTLPFIYIEDLQSSDDYYSNHSRATFVRWIRIASVFITLLSPAVYIAIILHHYRAIPLKFLITIVNTTKGLPLTPFAEILFVLILFEILYEASLRMPKYLGLALSIVGALILGDTAVKAGLISPPAVMIVAISGLTIYCVPDQAPQLYVLRFLFTCAGAMLGFFGITAVLIFLVSYLNDLDSYDTPYLAPLSPLIKNDLKDFLYKTDIVNMTTRPMSISNNKKNIKRQANKNGKTNKH